MTSSPFQDAVAIDTNVFMHLLNPHENVGSHINKLLEYLQAQDAHLIIDSNNRILGEYNHHIAPIIVKNDDTRNEIYILRYWILNAPSFNS